jgi:predicted N-acetyltransferase YhbS
MQITSGSTGRETEIAALFKTAFTASEGAEEGASIGRLAINLMTTTDADDLHVFTADDNRIVGACIFTRLRHEGATRRTWLLSPVAVAPDRQGQGIGQKMLAEALAALRAGGADVAVTYGDPAFYGRVGFEPVTVDKVSAPYPLSHPEGWLAQSLTDQPLAPLKGRVTCAPALSDPAFW